MGHPRDRGRSRSTALLGHAHAIELVDGGPAAADGSLAAATDPRSAGLPGGLVSCVAQGPASVGWTRRDACAILPGDAGDAPRSHEAVTGLRSLSHRLDRSGGAA